MGYNAWACRAGPYIPSDHPIPEGIPCQGGRRIVSTLCRTARQTCRGKENLHESMPEGREEHACGEIWMAMAEPENGRFGARLGRGRLDRIRASAAAGSRAGRLGSSERGASGGDGRQGSCSRRGRGERWNGNRGWRRCLRTSRFRRRGCGRQRNRRRRSFWRSWSDRGSSGRRSGERLSRWRLGQRRGSGEQAKAGRRCFIRCRGTERHRGKGRCNRERRRRRERASGWRKRRVGWEA